jgi:RNA recognition motif-containing protein
VSEPAPAAGALRQRPAFNDLTRDLYVSGLPFRLERDSDLFELAVGVSPPGSVVDARICRYRETGKSRGFGFLRCSTPEARDLVMAAIDGLAVGTRTLWAAPTRGVAYRAKEKQ